MFSTTSWDQEEFKAQIMAKGLQYHIHHPLHIMMNSGKLTKQQIQGWVANRYYYQISIPRKDAAILANCPDREIRRRWIQRIVDHDGTQGEEGGIEAWLRLGEAVGLTREALSSQQLVLPGVRFAVDAYRQFAQSARWEEAVCSSLTELFAPEIHQKRLDSWPQHYTWIDASGYQYFRTRLDEARRDVEHGLEVTLNHFVTAEQQQRALNIIQFKLEVLWSMLDAMYINYIVGIQMPQTPTIGKISLAQGHRLQWEQPQGCYVLLYPEGMVKLNQSSSEILKLCDGTKNQDEIVERLYELFPGANLKNDVNQFISEANKNGWINIK